MKRILDSLRHRLASRWASRSLGSLAPLACDAGPLRLLAAGDLEAILSSERIDREWAEAAPDLAAVCAIEDGRTEGVNPGDRRAVFYLTRGLKPRLVLEVGTHVGASTLHLAVALERAEEEGVRPALTTVDIEDVNDPASGPWKRKGLAMSPRQMIEAAGCGERVRFVVAGSLDFLDRCRERYDFIFLDGDHSARTVYQEIPRALRVLRRNGVILLHDYFPRNEPLWPGAGIEPGPFLAVERLRAEDPALEVLPLGELPWETKLGSRLTSLAVLTHRRG